MTIAKTPSANSIQSSPSPGSTAAKTTRSPQRSFIAVWQEQQRGQETRPAETPTKTPAALPPATAKPVEATSPAKKLVQNALDADRQVDAMLRAAASGKTFSPSELLALQAQVFRYSQTVEVISRGADKLVGGVKQTLSTQV